MRSSVVLALACAALGRAQSTTGPSQALITTVLTSPITSPYTNGFTSFLVMTNSQGVVTGMPSVVTEQPVIASTPAGASSALTVTLPSPSSDMAAGASPTAGMAGGDMGDNDTGASSGFATATGSGGNATVASATPTAASESDSASGTSTPTSSGSASASSSGAAAPFYQPAIGMGLAGVVFAAFL